MSKTLCQTRPALLNTGGRDRIKAGACLPDVVELPVQYAHGLGVRVGLDAAPVGCGSLVAPRLHHLHAKDTMLSKWELQMRRDGARQPHNSAVAGEKHRTRLLKLTWLMQDCTYPTHILPYVLSR